jgi:DNA-binding SARP family transcriptional activator
VSTTLRLLEPPHLLFQGKPGDITPQKPVFLLLYLALKHDWVSRNELLVVFYPEDDEQTARHNLRVLINRAKALPWSEGLEVETQRLRWQVESDVRLLREAVARKDWQTVIRLHQQPLLTGLNLETASGFEAWLELERESLLTSWRKAALEQVHLLSQQSRHSEAREILARLLERDTLAEDILALYLEQAYLSGQRDEALNKYQQFKHTLSKELGLEPLETTRQLANTIQRSATLKMTTSQPVQKSSELPLTLRRPPTLVAREQEQQQVVQNRTPVLVVSGEPGVGKTRLLQETIPSALWLRCHEGLALPYYPLLELIRANSSRLGDLSFYREDLARLLPELAPQHTPVALEPAIAKTRLLEALAFVLESFGQPLVFDDVQWCDTATLEVFVFLAARKRLRLYATCRQGEKTAELKTVLGTLRRQNILTEIELDPFNQQDIQVLLAELIGIPRGPEKFSSWLFAHSSGNVLFALETLRNLFEQGILREEGGNWHSNLDEVTHDYSELSIPPKVAELITRRLESLSLETRRVVQAASVMREGFTARHLSQLVGLSELATLDALEQAEANGLIQGERFSHDLFRQSIYKTLPTSRRQLQHAMLADLLQTEPLVSAGHWRQAGKPDHAWQIELDVANTQLGRGLLSSSFVMLDVIAAEAPAQHPLRLEALVLAGTYLHLLDTQRAETYLIEVLNTPGLSANLNIRALLAYTDTLVYQGNTTRAKELITQLEHQEVSDLELRLRLEHARLEVMLRSGDFAAADASLAQVYLLDRKNITTQSYEAQLRYYQARYREAAALFENMRHQDPECVRTLTLENDLGTTYWMLGQLAAAEKELQNSLVTWRGSPHVEALSHMHLGFVRLSQGRIKEAVAFAEKAIAYSQTLGSLTFEGDAWQRLGVIYFQSGQLTKARDMMETATAKLREVGDPYRLSQSSSQLANIYVLLGDTARGEALLQEAEALLKLAPNPFVTAFTHQAKALLALHEQQPDQAKTFLKKVEAFARANCTPEFLCIIRNPKISLHYLQGMCPSKDV